jgi:hypothetical protein
MNLESGISAPCPNATNSSLPADIPSDSAPLILSYCACILQIGFDADGTLVPSCFEPVEQMRHKRIVGAYFERPQEGDAKAIDVIERPSSLRIAVRLTKPNAGAKFAPTPLNASVPALSLPIEYSVLT